MSERLRQRQRGTEPGRDAAGRTARRPARPHPGKLPLAWVFRQVPGAVWATDKTLRITYALGRIGGEGLVQDATGSTVEEFLGSDDPAQPPIVAHRAALAGRSSSFRYAFRGRWYDVLVEPLRDPRDAIVGCVGAAVDATARRQAEERLEESQARLAQAQRMAHVGSWTWKAATDTVEGSDELYRIYGLGTDEPLGTLDAFLRRVHPDDAEPLREAVFRAVRERTRFSSRHRIVRPDGEARMLHTSGEALVGDGGAAGLVASSADVTEAWVAEAERERSLSLLRATLESTADGLLVVDTRGLIAAHNHHFVDMWKIPPNVIARGEDAAAISSVLDQLEDPDAFLHRVRDLYDRPEEESFDVLHLKDGRTFERYSQPQSLGHRVVGRVWSFRDVTERERLYQSALFLADASRLLASLDIESALDAVAHLSLSYLSDACAMDLLSDGEGPRRLTAVTREPLVPPPGEVPRAASTGHPVLYSVGGRSAMTMPLRARGQLLGSITFVARSGRRYESKDLDLAQELGRRVELALENARLFRGAEEALHARDEFLAVAAHEIRGPLTSIHLMVQALQKPTTSDDRRRDALTIVEREDRRLARLVDELVDLAHVRSGDLHFELEEVDLVEVTRAAVLDLTYETRRSGSSLSVTAEAKVMGVWDRTRLAQVVRNLVSNAIKFGQGKPIEIGVGSHAGDARLVVRDHGIGIALEQQNKLFQPFHRAVSARHYGGLGLGLYITRTIVEGLGGKIHIESRPGEGSAVTVELPSGRRGS